jgi:hypothetical protein
MRKNLEKVVQALEVYGLSGEPALLAPQCAKMRRETARGNWSTMRMRFKEEDQGFREH